MAALATLAFLFLWHTIDARRPTVPSQKFGYTVDFRTVAEPANGNPYDGSLTAIPTGPQTFPDAAMMNGDYVVYQANPLQLFCQNSGLDPTNLLHCQGRLEPNGVSACNFTGSTIYQRVQSPQYFMYMDKDGYLTIRESMNFSAQNPCFIDNATSPAMAIFYRTQQGFYRSIDATQVDKCNNFNTGGSGGCPVQPTDFTHLATSWAGRSAPTALGSFLIELFGKPITTDTVNVGLNILTPAWAWPISDGAGNGWDIRTFSPNPTTSPTKSPSTSPSRNPSLAPTTPIPTSGPTTSSPSASPTPRPTFNPIVGVTQYLSNCITFTLSGQWPDAFVGQQASNQFNQLLGVFRGSPTQHNVWSNGAGVEIQYTRMLDKQGHWVIGNSTYSLISPVILVSDTQPHNGPYYNFPHNNVLLRPQSTADLVFTCGTGTANPSTTPTKRPSSAPTQTNAGVPTVAPLPGCVSNGLFISSDRAANVQGSYYLLPTPVNNRPQYTGVPLGATNENTRLFHDAILQAWVLYVTNNATFSWFYKSNSMFPPLDVLQTWHGEKTSNLFEPPLTSGLTITCYVGAPLNSIAPTPPPVRAPSRAPATTNPTAVPTVLPTGAPTLAPSAVPSAVPTVSPTLGPTTFCVSLIVVGVPPPLDSLNGAYGVNRNATTSTDEWRLDNNPVKRIFFARSVSFSAWIITGPAGYLIAQDASVTRPILSQYSRWEMYNLASPFGFGFTSTVNITCEKTLKPTTSPSRHPSSAPTVVPSVGPSMSPSSPPTSVPSHSPSNAPSAAPSDVPSSAPSTAPTDSPSAAPTALQPCRYLTLNVLTQTSQMVPSGVYTESSSMAALISGYRQWQQTVGASNYKITYNEAYQEWQLGLVGMTSVWALNVSKSFRPLPDAIWYQRHLPSAFARRRLAGRRLMAGSVSPSTSPSSSPSSTPSSGPSTTPSTSTPTTTPATTSPSTSPSSSPSQTPSTSGPSKAPSTQPSLAPTAGPTILPIRILTSCSETLKPTSMPSTTPTKSPSQAPTNRCFGLSISFAANAPPTLTQFVGSYDRQSMMLQGKPFWKSRTNPPHYLRWHIDQWIISTQAIDGNTLWSGSGPNVNKFQPRSGMWNLDFVHGGGSVQVTISCGSFYSPSRVPTQTPTYSPTMAPPPKFMNCPSQTQFTFSKVGAQPTIEFQPLGIQPANTSVTCVPALGAQVPLGLTIVNCTAVNASCGFEARVVASTMNTLDVCRRYGPHVSVIVSETTNLTEFELAIPTNLQGSLVRAVSGTAWVPGLAGQSVSPCYIYAEYYPAATVASAIQAANPPTSGQANTGGGILGSAAGESSNLIWEIIVIVLLILVILLLVECCRRKLKERDAQNADETALLLEDANRLSNSAIAGVASEDQMRRATVTNQIQEKTRSDAPAGFAPSKRMASLQDLGVANQGVEMTEAPASPKMIAPLTSSTEQKDSTALLGAAEGSSENIGVQVPQTAADWEDEMQYLREGGYTDDTTNLQYLIEEAEHQVRQNGDFDRTSVKQEVESRQYSYMMSQANSQPTPGGMPPVPGGDGGGGLPPAVPPVPGGYQE